MTRLVWYYYEGNGRGRVYSFWKNMMEHIHEHQKTPDEVWEMVYSLLAEYNGYLVEQDFIEFYTEEDKLLFLLRWS